MTYHVIVGVVFSDRTWVPVRQTVRAWNPSEAETIAMGLAIAKHPTCEASKSWIVSMSTGDE